MGAIKQLQLDEIESRTEDDGEDSISYMPPPRPVVVTPSISQILGTKNPRKKSKKSQPKG